MQRLINVLENEKSYLEGDDFYHKLNSHTVINTIPCVHILHGQMDAKIVGDVAKYMDTINDNSANNDLVANITGDQSNMNLFDDLLNGYRDQLVKSCCDYVEIHTNIEREIVPCGCWSVKMNAGDFNPVHKHESPSSSGIATIFYVKVPNNLNANLKDGCLDFSWIRQTPDVKDIFYPRDTTTVMPQVGDYYVFPKWLNHCVYPMKGNQPRWSLQTNFDILPLVENQ